MISTENEIFISMGLTLFLRYGYIRVKDIIIENSMDLVGLRITLIRDCEKYTFHVGVHCEVLLECDPVELCKIFSGVSPDSWYIFIKAEEVYGRILSHREIGVQRCCRELGIKESVVRSCYDYLDELKASNTAGRNNIDRSQKFVDSESFRNIIKYWMKYSE